ncbi:MAG: UPF0149 family protein [Gammaproteobacteria bacterium]|nr:UPF0149 family protein [Gammaproteobacteria bacterium]
MTQTDTSLASGDEFQQRLYLDLDEKLRQSNWGSSVSEAHGLLCGLACRGVTDQEIKNRMFLFQVSEPKTMLILEGLFNLALRDLSAEGFSFNLLLPHEDSPIVERTEEMSNWAQGFLQGFCHDGEAIIHHSKTINEIITDIITIGNIEPDVYDQADPESEKDLFEIHEYLKVSIQLIYDEINDVTHSHNVATH